MNKIKDTDLREALHRKYAETPKLPADFMTKMEEKLKATPTSVPNDAIAGKARRPWRWIAAAASLLLLIGIGVTLMPSGEEGEPGGLTAQHTETKEQPSISKTTSYDQQNDELPSAKQRVAVNDKEVISEEVPTKENVPAYTSADDPNLHYASNEATTDTVPYQEPARVDEFITKFANYYKVKEGELKCSATQDSNVVSAVYVFPDTKEIDVFSRLLQAACWYSDETPGYLLSFSHQQFFFELKDMRKQLHYRWIAERINGKILLYSTHVPLGTRESSACYQEYRDELMHIKSINNKTKKI